MSKDDEIRKQREARARKAAYIHRKEQVMERESSIKLVLSHPTILFSPTIRYNKAMYELIITTRMGITNHVGVRDWREASSELARFERDYFRNHPNDGIMNACVLDSAGNIVSRYYRGGLEAFN